MRANAENPIVPSKLQDDLKVVQMLWRLCGGHLPDTLAEREKLSQSD